MAKTMLGGSVLSVLAAREAIIDRIPTAGC